MDLGSDIWLIIGLILPWLAIVLFLLLRQRVKPSKKSLDIGIFVAIALLTAYFIWSFYFRPD